MNRDFVVVHGWILAEFLFSLFAFLWTEMMLWSIKNYGLYKSALKQFIYLRGIKAGNPERARSARVANQNTGFASYLPRALPAM